MNTFFDMLIEKTNCKRSGFARHYMLLYSIVFGLEAKSCFEFGTGFSSSVILQAMKDSNGLQKQKLTSCDVRPLDKFYGTIPNDDVMWTFVQKDSTKVVLDLPKQLGFDFVLHDGSHVLKEVQQDLMNIIPHIKQNGIILIHDTCNRWKKEMMPAIKTSFRDVKHDYINLCYGCGLVVIRMQQDFGLGKVQPIWRVDKSKHKN